MPRYLASVRPLCLATCNPTEDDEDILFLSTSGRRLSNIAARLAQTAQRFTFVVHPGTVVRQMAATATMGLNEPLRRKVSTQMNHSFETHTKNYELAMSAATASSLVFGATSLPSTTAATTSTASPPKKKKVRKYYSSAVSESIRRTFSENIIERTRPYLSDCRKFLTNNPAVDRTAKQMQDKVWTFVSNN